eukprot:9483061-Pyramimonas_sp.AAC.1
MALSLRLLHAKGGPGDGTDHAVAAVLRRDVRRERGRLRSGAQLLQQTGGGHADGAAVAHGLELRAAGRRLQSPQQPVSLRGTREGLGVERVELVQAICAVFREAHHPRVTPAVPAVDGPHEPLAGRAPDRRHVRLQVAPVVVHDGVDRGAQLRKLMYKGGDGTQRLRP